MASWREELVEVVKSQSEREQEERERQQKRLKEALEVADEAMTQAVEGLQFVNQQLKSKSQPSSYDQAEGHHTLALHDQKLAVGLSRDDAVLKVIFNDSRPREFDFAKDRHLSPKDVEEYVGRRAVELARAAQKQNPW